jgi:CRP-like cAMP-binding protein
MTDAIEPEALIRRLTALTELAPNDVSELSALCQTVKAFDAKQDIARDHEPATRVHLMLEGWAARYKMLPNGRRQITALLIPGDFCDLHITLFGRRNDGIVALTKARVAVIDSDLIDRLTTERTNVTRALWWTGLIDAAVLREWVANIGRRAAEAAVAHIICELHLRMRAVELVSSDRFSLPLTQEDLGDAVGLTSVHVNRILQRMRAQGLLEFRQRVVTILDLEGLREMAGFESDYLGTGLQRRAALD